MPRETAGVAERIAYTIKELATSLGVSPKTIRRAIADGEVRTFRLRGCVLIPSSEVERLLRGGQ